MLSKRLPILAIMVLVVLIYAAVSSFGTGIVGWFYLAHEGACERCNMLQAWPKMNIPMAVSFSLISAGVYGALLLGFALLYRRRWKFSLLTFGVTTAIYAFFVAASIGARTLKDTSLGFAVGVWTAFAIAGIAIAVTFRPRRAGLSASE